MSGWPGYMAGGLFLACVVAMCGCSEEPSHPRVFVLGFDGMDPRMCTKLMDAGRMPNLARLRQAGGFRPLGTSIPPQSPVAWASFITGANPGVHGIFDFIHRDPSRQVFPYYSAAETIDGDGGWEVDGHRLPLPFWPFRHQAPETRLRRGGEPFWDYLDAAGVPVQLYDIPANYPPSESHHGHMCCLAGMGVPDLMGGYGTYQFYSEETFREKSEGGGLRWPLFFDNDHARVKLRGPANAFKVPARGRPAPSSELPFDIYRHPTRASARIEFENTQVQLNEGEWSDWVRLEFNLSMPRFLPSAPIRGICRFFLQEVRPNFRLYVTPINIDPSDPGDLKITEPPEFITEISDALGLFYTAGFQEDHKALYNGIFTDAEYKLQAGHVLDERLNLLEFARDRYRDGLLFFYFSSTDLQGHMFWWDDDSPHPVRSKEEADKYHRVMLDLYARMDAIVGDVLGAYPDATVLVMSDHGFCNFRRQFNVNTWLVQEGYIKPDNCDSILFGRTPDWSRTKAYGLGLNGLYLNLRGREREGVVLPAERDALLDEISKKLLAYRDPDSGAPVVKTVYRADEVYSGPLAGDAPDLIIGYHRGYRAAWSATLGNMSKEVLFDNDKAWSADHCIAADEVPGVVFANRPIAKPDPSLVDIAPTVLTLFGVEVPASMEGRDIFAPVRRADAKRSATNLQKETRPWQN